MWEIKTYFAAQAKRWMWENALLQMRCESANIYLRGCFSLREDDTIPYRVIVVLDSLSAIIIIQKLHTIFGSFGDRWIFVLSAKGDIFVARETNWCCIIAVSAYCCFQIVCCCVYRSGVFFCKSHFYVTETMSFCNELWVFSWIIWKTVST